MSSEDYVKGSELRVWSWVVTASMPLVERYGDWDITDGSFDDPHTLDFDHRIEAVVANSESGLVNIEDNVKATCVLTILKPEFGWTQVQNSWLYDPSKQKTDLNSIWQDCLPACVRHDKDYLKECLCNPTTNPATAYVGAEARYIRDNIDKLEWPKDTTEFVSRFDPTGQYVIGPKFSSAYHLGDGWVGTAGHTLDKALIGKELGELRAVFNWIGNVGGKKVFTESEVFNVERVVFCETHGPAPSPVDSMGIHAWSSKCDSAIFKLEGTPDQFSHLKCTKYATRPPAFGNPVYSIGSPLGTQLKISANAHVLRHSLAGDEMNPFSHRISGSGTFTTDLDQFEGDFPLSVTQSLLSFETGNSGGPVFDATTGQVVGHTSSTQNAVAECDADAIESWAREHAKGSRNYNLAAEINRVLEKQDPDNRFYRIHPKFLRTLSGRARDSPLIRCTICLCPDDIGPNRAMQMIGKYQAVFSRHHFNSQDVFLRNISARVDRNAFLMKPLNELISDFAGCTLSIKFVCKPDSFEKPDANSTINITSNAIEWNIRHLGFRKDERPTIPHGTHVWSATLDLASLRHEIPPAFVKASHGVISWTKVHLEQRHQNPPLMLGLNLCIRRKGFAFAVNKSWPPERPDVTDNPADVGLEWPAEAFEYATTVGETSSIHQRGDASKSVTEGRNGPECWMWEAPLDRVWTNPKQPSHGLGDPLMDDGDEPLV